MKLYHDYFGQFGGRYVAEVLRPALSELEKAFIAAAGEDDFEEELKKLAADYSGRPTPLLHAENSSKALGGAQIYIKLEGLAATGAHKINNALGQALLAKRMGKKRSSPRPEPASTGWPPPPPAPNSDWNAESTWARWTSGGNTPMSSGWSSTALRWYP